MFWTGLILFYVFCWVLRFVSVGMGLARLSVTNDESSFCRHPERSRRISKEMFRLRPRTSVYAQHDIFLFDFAFCFRRDGAYSIRIKYVLLLWDISAMLNAKNTFVKKIFYLFNIINLFWKWIFCLNIQKTQNNNIVFVIFA